MKNAVRKGNLGKCIMVLVLVSSVFVLAGDVVVQEGVIEGVKFQSTGCSTVDGTKAVAFGYDTEASGDYSTAMGYLTTASENYSTAMGNITTASGSNSTAMGYNTEASGTHSTAMGYTTTASGIYSTAMGYGTTAGPAVHTTAIGNSFTNNVAFSFAVGYSDEDFRVRSDLVNVYGDLVVDDKVGIGTASPDNLLSIKSSVASEDWAIHFTADDNGNVMYIGKDSADNFFLYGYDGAGGCDVSLRTGGAPSYINSGNVGIATTSPTAKLDVNSDIIRLRTSKTPASASAAGNAGDICWDSNYIYIRVATNTWKRSAISSW